MGRSVPALITPRVLEWAREQAGYSISEVASKLGINDDQVAAWESGPAHPSVAKARELAKLYRRPLALLYLGEPPKSYDVLKDYRRLPGTFRREESPELLWAIRQARYRRRVALDLLRSSGEEPPRFHEAATLRDNPEEVGRRIRGYLAISVQQQREFRTPYDALSGWREAVESKGILVFQAERASLEEMRALCLPEDPMPAILLNGADQPYGRIFSLVHEVVHLCLSRGGTLSTGAESRLTPEDQRIEVFGNRAAAAALLPQEAVLTDPVVLAQPRNSDWPEDVLKTLSNRYSVSRETFLRRLVTLGRASESLYRHRRAQWEAIEKLRPSRKSEGAPPVPVRVLSRVGRGFARIVLESYRRGAITLLDVSNYFDMKPKWLPDFEKHLAGRPLGRSMA